MVQGGSANLLRMFSEVEISPHGLSLQADLRLRFARAAFPLLSQFCVRDADRLGRIAQRQPTLCRRSFPRERCDSDVQFGRRTAIELSVHLDQRVQTVLRPI